MHDLGGSRNLTFEDRTSWKMGWFWKRMSCFAGKTAPGPSLDPPLKHDQYNSTEISSNMSCLMMPKGQRNLQSSFFLVDSSLTSSRKSSILCAANIVGDGVLERRPIRWIEDSILWGDGERDLRPIRWRGL